MRTQQPDNKSPPPEQGVNWVELFISSAALPLELLLHNVFTFGVRSAGPRGAGAVLFMYAFAMCYTAHRTPLLVLTVVIGVLIIIAHISAVTHHRRGGSRHTLYNGRPYIMTLFPISEDRAKRMEPLMGVTLGWLVHHLNYPLGTFLLISASCHGLRVVLESLATRTRSLDLSDALIEQTHLMDFNRRRVRRR